MSKYGDFSGKYFHVFGLSTEIYSLNIRIKSKYWKIQNRKNSVFRHSRKLRGTPVIAMVLDNATTYRNSQGKGVLKI